METVGRQIATLCPAVFTLPPLFPLIIFYCCLSDRSPAEEEVLKTDLVMPVKIIRKKNKVTIESQRQKGGVADLPPSTPVTQTKKHLGESERCSTFATLGFAVYLQGLNPPPKKPAGVHRKRTNTADSQPMQSVFTLRVCSRDRGTAICSQDPTTK